ncbi:MAG: ribonuclease Z, partial [Candidatus Bathyarchaeia archaeon]
MSLEVIFLGTGGSMPTRRRGLPSIAVRREGEIILFDCGEGTQRQAVTASLSTLKISRIFITHLHGDHVLGLPGLIQSMALLGRTSLLEIYGPAGLASFLEAVRFTVPCSIGFPISVYEVSEGIVYEDRSYKVEAAWMDHTIPCLGYSLTENPRPGRFHPEIAEGLGVPKGPLWKRLQMGESVEVEGGIIHPSKVVGPPRPGVKLSYSGDTRPHPNLKKIAFKSDLLIYDSTFDDSRRDKAAEYGHSTSRQAAQMAKEVKADRLALTHISPIYEGSEDKLLLEAEEIFTGEVLLASDLAHFKIQP